MFYLLIVGILFDESRQVDHIPGLRIRFRFINRFFRPLRRVLYCKERAEEVYRTTSVSLDQSFGHLNNNNYNEQDSTKIAIMYPDPDIYLYKILNLGKVSRKKVLFLVARQLCL